LGNEKIARHRGTKSSFLRAKTRYQAEPLASTDTLKMGPDDKIYVIDLKAKPPKLVNTLTVGKQPSGLSFNPTGNLALVANRVDKSIAVLSVKGTEVKLIDTVPMDDIVTHVAFTPDGKHALATKFNANKVSLLDVDGDKVTYAKLDLLTGLWPYNVAVAPTGDIALTADAGNGGYSDGSVHDVDVVDLKAQPPRIIDRVVVGDAPEGLAFSPKGNIAVAAIYRGSNNKNAWYYHRNGSIAVLRIDGKKVTKIKEIEVGGLPSSREQTLRIPANASKSPATPDRSVAVRNSAFLSDGPLGR
jgi:DNA-binding beta-propeller fold protein YncE